MSAPKITEPGVYTLSLDAYHAHDSLSSSGARQLLAECPARFRYGEPGRTKALDLGDAAHEWILEGEAWPQRHVVLNDDFNARTKDGKARIEEIEASGRRPLKASDFAIIKAMKQALEAHPLASAAFHNGKPEQSLFWRCSEFGIWCRARPDYLRLDSRIVPDYKTTRSAEPEYLMKAMFEYGYHQQAEWYLRGIETLGLIEEPRMLFVFQEKEPPFLVTCVTPSDVALQWAALQNRKAREVYARCLQTGVWPGYADDVVTLDLPVWAEHRLHDRSERGKFEIAAQMQSPQAAE